MTTEALTPETTTKSHPAKRGRPAGEDLAPGARGPMRDGIRLRKSKDGRSVSYQVKVSTRDPKTGALLTVWKSFSTRKDAETTRNALRSDKDAGRFVAPSQLTVREWVTDYSAGRQVAPTSKERYAVYAGHIAAWFVTTKIQAVKVSDVSRFRDALTQPPFSFKWRYARAVLCFLKAALAQAVKEAVIKSNPCDDAEMPNNPGEEERQFYNASDVANILHILAGDEIGRASCRERV